MSKPCRYSGCAAFVLLFAALALVTGCDSQPAPPSQAEAPAPPPPKRAPSVATIQETCRVQGAALKDAAAYAEIVPPDDAAQLRHLLIGRVSAGNYTDIALGDAVEVYRVTPQDNRLEHTVAATPRSPFVITRHGKGLRFYAAGRRVCEVAVAEGTLEVACAWTRPAAPPAADTNAATAAAPAWQPLRTFALAPLRFSDDFMRTVVGRDDGWKIAAGRWRISQEADPDAAPNNFELAVKADAEPARMSMGHRFWNDYRFEAAVEPAKDGALGLTFGETDAGRYRVALRADSDPGVLELVRVDGKDEKVLAQRQVALAPGRWLRLAVAVSEDAPLRVFIDGVPMLGSSPADPAAFGLVGLYATGPGGRFDDVSVLSLADVPEERPLREVVQYSKTFKDKPAYERDDRDIALQAWASDNDAWTGADLPRDKTTLKGFVNSTVLFGDFTAIVAPHDAPQVLALHDSAGACLATQALAPAQAPQRFRREGDALLLNDVPNGTLRGAAGVHIGLYAAGGIAPTADRPRILSRTVDEEFFETAPARWLPVNGRWRLTNRWACNPKWNFFGGVGGDDVILFSKNRYDGNQAHEFYHGMKDVFAREFELRRYVRRDVGFSFCTNGRDLNSGYTFIWAAYHNGASILMKGDTVVAWNQEKVFPTFHESQDIMQLHLKWWRIDVEKIDNRIRVRRDGELIFDWVDSSPDAPRGGHIAFWTHKNGIIYARVKSSAERVANDAKPYLQPQGAAELDGWRSLDPARVRLQAADGGGVAVANRFGGGFFAAQWVLPKGGIDLTAAPVLRLPFTARDGAKVNLHAVVSGEGMVLTLNGPTTETYQVLGRGSFPWDSWYTYAAPTLGAPEISDTTILDAKTGIATVNLLDEARRRFPKLKDFRLTSLIVGNASNEKYLLAGFGGNTAAASYALGKPEFSAAR